MTPDFLCKISHLGGGARRLELPVCRAAYLGVLGAFLIINGVVFGEISFGALEERGCAWNRKGFLMLSDGASLHASSFSLA